MSSYLAIDNTTTQNLNVLVSGQLYTQTYVNELEKVEVTVKEMRIATIAVIAIAILVCVTAGAGAGLPMLAFITIPIIVVSRAKGLLNDEIRRIDNIYFNIANELRQNSSLTIGLTFTNIRETIVQLNNPLNLNRHVEVLINNRRSMMTSWEYLQQACGESLEVQAVVTNGMRDGMKTVNSLVSGWSAFFNH